MRILFIILLLPLKLVFFILMYLLKFLVWILFLVVSAIVGIVSSFSVLIGVIFSVVAAFATIDAIVEVRSGDMELELGIFQSALTWLIAGLSFGIVYVGAYVLSALESIGEFLGNAAHSFAWFDII